MRLIRSCWGTEEKPGKADSGKEADEEESGKEDGISWNNGGNAGSGRLGAAVSRTWIGEPGISEGSFVSTLYHSPS